MKKIETKLTSEEVLKLLEQSQSVTINDSPLLTDWGIIEDDKDDRILCFNWDDDKRGYFIYFTKKSLSRSKRVGDKLILVDDKGNDCEVYLFKLENFLTTF